MIGRKVPAALGLLLACAAATAALAAVAPSELLVADGPAKVIAGPVAPGQAFLTLPVRHRRTGRLLNRITLDSVFGRDAPLEPGQVVFGGPVQGGMAIWCAPRLRPDGRTYQTACLTPSHAGLYEWEIRRTPALAPADIGMTDGGWSGQASSAPEVRPGPISLPPMTLSLTLEDAGPEGRPDGRSYDGRSYKAEVTVDWGEGPKVYGRLPIAMTGRGGRLDFMGVGLRFAPGPQPGQLVVSKRRGWLW